MGYASENGWTWTAPLEWAKGSPWRPEGLDALREEDRLRMAAVLANKELGFQERRLARAFRDPRDLRGFILAGVEEWGVDAKFAPMRALGRAEWMDQFLRSPPANSGAAWAWKNAPDGHRSGAVAGLLSPSNAFTLIFKRRALPEMAAASMALKGWGTAGALSAAWVAGALGPGGALMGAFAVLVGVARALEVVSSDHGKEEVRELWALRKMAGSPARLERLARGAFERARALGHRLQGEPESVGKSQKESALEIQGLLGEARRIDKEREALLRGDLLTALDRSERAAGLREKAEELRSKAREEALAQRRAKAPSYGDIKGHLRWFSREAREKGWTAIEMDQLRGMGQARVESAEVGAAIEPAPRRSGSRAPGGSRL